MGCLKAWPGPDAPPRRAFSQRRLMRISIVTTSFNHGAYLEAAMRSVLDQAGPETEYIVVDGGSSDGSAALIERYAPRLKWWVSEPDGGYAQALNKGFARTTGEVMGWLNSDDMLTPWALSVVEEIFTRFPQVEWISSLHPLIWDARGRAVRMNRLGGFNRHAFLRGEHLPRPGVFHTDFIQQESTFWRRSLWEKAGGRLNEALGIAQDFELWARFFQHAELIGVDVPLGGWRFHGEQKTGAGHEGYLAEAEALLLQYGGRRHSAAGRLWRRFGQDFCPRPLRPLAAHLGACYPATICRNQFRGPGWELVPVWF